jgi:hypothetical protein
MVSLVISLTPLRIILKPRVESVSVEAAARTTVEWRREGRAVLAATPKRAVEVMAVACILE